MIKLLSAILSVLMLLCVSGCTTQSTVFNNQDGVSITDCLGNTCVLDSSSKIVVCYGSFAECLQLSGLEPVGVTSDATDDHNLTFPKSTAIVGSVKSVNLETIIQLEPDYIILSADLSAHLKLESSLKSLKLNYGYFRIDSFDDYDNLMAKLCEVSGRDDLYRKNVVNVKENISAIKASFPKNSSKSALLIRAFSTGIKAKGDDNLAGQILNEMGIHNIVDENPSFLQSISLEEILIQNPDYIFVLTMGDEQEALRYLEQELQNNRFWQSLNAVKQGNYIILPKNLFHYKPNNRWDDSYEYLAKIIFPEISR